MASNAYILINVEPAKPREVIDRLKTVSGAAVREVLGSYDVVMELEAGTSEDLTGILRHQIRPIDGVTNTVTCLWFTANI